MIGEYGEDCPVVYYGNGEAEEGYIHFRVCPKCGRYVKADKQSRMPEYSESNATCKKCGRVQMPFFGWQTDD